MPRRRLNDNPLLVYAYRAYLPGMRSFEQVPGFMKDEARAGMDYWNDLVRLGNQDTEEYRAIIADSPHVEAAQQQFDLLKDQTDQAYQDLKQLRSRNRSRQQTPEVRQQTAHLKKLRQQKKEVAVCLKEAKKQARTEKKAVIKAHQAEWDEKMKAMRQAQYLVQGNKERIRDSFLTALRENRKEGVALKPKYWPLREVHFTELYTGGLTLRQAEADGGRFVLGGWIEEQRKHRCCTLRIRHISHEENPHISFQIAYHRPLPSDVRIKRIDLVGRQVVQRGWRFVGTHGRRQAPRMEWKLLITCEVPKPDFYRPTSSRLGCGIDIGYRQVDNGIRVAALVGEDGHEEVLTLPSKIVKRWRYGYTVLHSDLDKLTDKIKAALQKGFKGHTANLPAKAREILEELDNASRQRLLTLLELLPPDHPAVVPLQEWANRTTRIDREFRGLDHQVRRARNDFYRKWAYTVCQRYKEVNVEALSLKEMSEQDKGGRLKLAEKQRAFACLSVLRQYLKEASHKSQGQYIEREAAQSSSLCAEHRVRLNGRKELWRDCPEGHTVDRDINAAKNLLYNQAPAGNKGEEQSAHEDA